MCLRLDGEKVILDVENRNIKTVGKCFQTSLESLFGSMLGWEDS